jgi:hypothetical protein
MVEVGNLNHIRSNGYDLPRIQFNGRMFCFFGRISRYFPPIKVEDSKGASN